MQHVDNYLELEFQISPPTRQAELELVLVLGLVEPGV